MQVINSAALLVSLYLLVQLSLGSGPPMSPQDSGDIGRPIDWTTGQLKNPVFTFTNCSQLIPGTNLTQPCESIIYITPFTAIGNLTYTVFTVSDYQTVIVETMHESEGLWGSQDFSFVEWMSGYIEDDYSFSVCHATWSLFEAVLSDIKSIALWESFQKDLNTVYKLLDGKYSYDILYKEIILKYGTHVPIRANYGGSIKYVSMLMNCIARMYSQTWVTEQTQAVFDLAVDGYSYTQVSSCMYDASVCSSQWLFLGGPTIEYPSPPAVSEWVSDLGQNPVYLGFGGDWAMLSAIVPANYTGLPEMVANAIQQYINNAQVTQPTMTEYIFPYISPPDYAGMGCEGSCTQGCWGQIACEGQSCIYPGPVTVSKIHDAPCGYDDDDCDHENNCVVNLDAEGYCGLFSTDCHRVCFAPYYSTLATQVPCQSAAQCYPYS